MPRLSALESPFICCTVIDRSLEEAIRTIRLGALEGADAFEIHLPLLGYPPADELARVFDATTRPVYATSRRASFYPLVGLPESEVETIRRSDEDRIDELVDAVAAGAAGIDMELDSFDPQPGLDFDGQRLLDHAVSEDATPAELTTDAEAIQRQEQVVDHVHELGGEVLFSCHPLKHLTPDEALEIAERMVDRGADLAKLVGVDPSFYHVLDTLEANLDLNRTLSIPFNMMSMGGPTRVGRLMYPFFGSDWIFCQVTHYPNGFEAWPLVEHAREVFRRVDWEPAREAHRTFLK